MWCGVVWYVLSIFSQDITPTSSGLTYRRTPQATEKCNSGSDPMTLNNSISSTDVIGQWEGKDERRTVNNSREDIQDTRIPRTSYSQEWLCIQCGVFVSTLFYNTTSGHGTFFLFSFFLSFFVFTSVYLLIVALDHTQWHTHTHTHSARLLWTRDQPDAETSTFQHTTLTTDIHAPSGIQTLNPSKRAASDPCLRQSGYRDRLQSTYKTMFWRFINCKFSDMKENYFFIILTWISKNINENDT
jgi:hypothetical protein